MRVGSTTVNEMISGKTNGFSELALSIQKTEIIMTILVISCYCGDDKKTWCASKLF